MIGVERKLIDATGCYSARAFPLIREKPSGAYVLFTSSLGDKKKSHMRKAVHT